MAYPIQRKFKIARNLILVAGVAFAASPTFRALQTFQSLDPFAEMMQGVGNDPSFAMRMEGVQFKHYDRGRMVAYAKADQIDLLKDRHTYDMRRVHDAFYQGDVGSFRYSADHAVYVEGPSILDANGNVRIQNKDLDLRAGALQVFGDRKRVTVGGKVTGKLSGGQTEAENVIYHLHNGAYSAGPVSWKGKLAMNLQESQEDADKPHAWEIKGDKVEFSGRGTEIATYTDAIAADGEIILIAPNVVHNRRTDVVTATGRVQYFSGKANIVADQCVVYRKEKRAVLTGNVQMLVKPKSEQDQKPKVEPLPAFQPLTPEQVVATPAAKATDDEKKKADKLRDSKTIRDYPTAISSENIEYWYGKGVRRAVITGAPQARQELPENAWRHIWTNVAYYDGELETLKMVSTKDKKDTRMKDSVGDDVTSDWMQVSTKEDDDSMTGRGFVGTIVSLNDDEETGGKGRGGKTPPAGTRPPTSTPPGGLPPGGTPPPKTGGGNGDSYRIRV